MRPIRILLLPVLFFARLFAGGQSNPSLFSEGSPGIETLRYCAGRTEEIRWLRLNEAELSRIFKEKPSNLLLDIPLGGGKNFRLNLRASVVESPAFRIRTSGGITYDKSLEKSLHFRGSVEGQKSSLVAISFSEREISGILSFGEGNFNLVKVRDGSRNQYALFNDRSIREENPFRCHSEEGLEPIHSPEKNTGGGRDRPESGNCRRVDIFFECDHRMYLDNGGTVGGTVNYLQSMFNVVAAIYAREGISIRISDVFIHTLQDSYPSGTSFEALSAFQDSLAARPFTGNLGHLLSTLPAANGGVAYLDVLCSQGIGYSNIYSSFLPLPFYSWTINVVAHELGHNFGSPHTQACSWETSPGVFGMIDSCFTAEGDCYTGPRIARVGTVMSYCHLMGLGVDLSKGFGLKPGNLIRERYLSAGCLAGQVDLPPLAISAPDSICTGSPLVLSVTQVPGATYAWTGPNGFSAGQATVSIPGAGPQQEGAYSVILSKDGCEALPLRTRVSVNCIFAVPLSSRLPCTGSSFQVNYASVIDPGPGNMFTVQMSDAAGNFGTPVVLGYLASTQKRGTISVRLPGNVAPDSGYALRLVSSNPVSTGNASLQKLRILPRPEGPQITGASRCGPGELQLFASSPDSIFWYASPDAEVPLKSGPVLQTGNLSSSRSYWAESRKIRRSRVGPVVNADTLTALNTYHGLFVRVKRPVQLDSVMVHPSGPGMVHFNIKDSANTFLYRKVTIPVSGIIGGEKIPVGLELSPGIYRVDAEGSTVPGLLRRNNFFDFPVVSEALDIIGSTVPSRYYFFFDWRISMPECASYRKEVKAQIFFQPSPPVISQAQNFVLSSADTLQQWYRDGNLLGVYGDTVDALEFGNGEYKTILLTSDSCRAVSNSLAVSFTGIPDYGDDRFQFFPNPGKGIFNLIFVENQRRELLCLDATGRQVWVSPTQSTHNRLDLSFLPDGLYALVIRSAGKTRVIRFRKQP